MQSNIVKILKTEWLTHDVRRFTVEKPKDYSFKPGQSTYVSLNNSKLKDEKRPFTITCLNDSPYLEFIIKVYENHEGITKELIHIKEGEELLIRTPYSTIDYSGPGVFIAGGVGITLFIGILRQLYKDGKIEGNKLFYSNRTVLDIILKDEFDKMLGKNFINTLTGEKNPEYEKRRIDIEYLKEKIDNFNCQFYICGTIYFVKHIHHALISLGANPKEVIF